MNQDKILTTVKAWLTPLLLTAVSIIMYDNMQEMKSDIKKLLAQSSADQIRLEYLEKEVADLRGRVYASQNESNNNNNNEKPKTELIAILPDKQDFYNLKYRRNSSL